MMTPNDFITKISKLAMADRKRSGVLASVTIAQACLESAYGGSELAQKACNLFGMKTVLSGSEWTGKTYEKSTCEEDSAGQSYTVVASFRAYGTWAESIADHSDYLTGAKKGAALRYAGLTEADAPEAQLAIIKNGGYATDTAYVSKLMSVIAAYNLEQFDKEDETMKVFIGVGHGGSDPGAVKYITEKTANLTIALKLKSELERHGVQVGISRTKDEDDPLSEEISEANAYGPDIAVDVHNNAGGGDGFEALYQTGVYKEKSYKLAQCIEKEVKAIGQASRGLKTKLNSAGTADYFGFLRQITCPAVIVEGFFVDNAADAAQFDTEAEQYALAVAYAKGILAYLGMTYKAADAAGYTVESAKLREEAYKEGTVRYVKSWLNLRTGPGTDKTVITTLAAGAAVTWYGYYAKVGTVKWVLVETAGKQTGWVNANYLRV